MKRACCARFGHWAKKSGHSPGPVSAEAVPGAAGLDAGPLRRSVIGRLPPSGWRCYWLALLLLSVSAACIGSSRHRAVSEDAGPTPRYYQNNGTELYLALDTFVSRLSLRDRSDYLPLFVAVLNKDFESLTVTRESFELELQDGGRSMRLALAAPVRQRRVYGRGTRNLRAGRAFLRMLDTRFPRPPYHWRDLEFFPLRATGTVHRDQIELRRAELAIGLIYFEIPPSLRPLPEVATLLFRAPESQDTYVLEFSLPAEK